MGGKGAMPAMPAPVVTEAPNEAQYLPEKASLPEIPQVTQAKLDEEKRKKFQRLASTDTRENTITNIGGALGDGLVEDGSMEKPNLFITPKTVGTSSTKGLLSS